MVYWVPICHAGVPLTVTGYPVRFFDIRFLLLLHMSIHSVPTRPTHLYVVISYPIRFLLDNVKRKHTITCHVTHVTPESKTRWVVFK